MKVFFGDKSAKDIKQIQPIIDKALSYGEEFKNLTNDQLRAKTQEFRDRVAAAVAEKEARIRELEAEAEAENLKGVAAATVEATDGQQEQHDDSLHDDEKARLEKIEKLLDEADRLKDDVYKITEDVLKEILPEAFAVVKETARRFVENPTLEVTAGPLDRELSATRPNVEISGDKALWHNTWDAAGKPVTWDMVHYDVQLIGGVVLHQGKIAEMATGEGKTLVATLPIYLNAIPGKGVHVVTVNNYLARRDAAWMGPLFEFHGLRVDCIDNHQPNSPERKKAYQADILPARQRSPRDGRTGAEGTQLCHSGRGGLGVDRRCAYTSYNIRSGGRRRRPSGVHRPQATGGTYRSRTESLFEQGIRGSQKTPCRRK